MGEPIKQEGALDLKNFGVTGYTQAASSQAPAFREEKFDKLRAQETIRGRIALWLVGYLVAFIAFLLLASLATQLWCAYSQTCSSEAIELKPLKTVAEVLLTPLVGLVGAVTGFYFGEKSGTNGAG